MIKCALQISNGAAQRGRTEGAVLPVRRSAPEHNPYMTSKQHSTTARWIRLGVNFATLQVLVQRRSDVKLVPSDWSWHSHGSL